MIDMVADRELTRSEIFNAGSCLLIFLVPLFFLVVYPDYKLVETTLGSGRVFIFWFLVYSLVGFKAYRDKRKKSIEIE